jgi:phage protein D
MTDELFGSVAPVFKIGGEVRGELARDLERLEIADSTEGLRTLSLRLVAQGPHGNDQEEKLLFLDGELLDFGSELEVSLGPGDAARTVFKGRVSALSAEFVEGKEPRVVVMAEDMLMKLRMTRRMKTYEKMTDAQIAEDVATANELGADVAADGPRYAVVQQWNQSDLAFLRDRARLLQAEVWFENDKVCFKTRGNRKATALTLVQGRDLVDVQVRADLAHQRGRVVVSGYDASARDRIDDDADGSAVRAEVATGRTGPQVLAQAIPGGERVSYRVRENPLQSGEATAWAKAEMLRRARAFVTVTGTTNGSPDMAVGSRLKLDRVGAPFDGDGYYVTRLCHTYDLQHGHRTHFDAERATVNQGGGR